MPNDTPVTTLGNGSQNNTTNAANTANTNGNNSDVMLAGVRASNEKHRTEIKRLKKDLEAERRNIKELIVLHQGDLRQVRQQEQDRAQALLNDLKTKLNHDKTTELSKQKEKLTKDHEIELLKMAKEHQDDIWRMSTDKKKEKEQIVKNLWDSKKTEDQKHSALLTELGKVTQELHDVRGEKLRLELELGSLTKSDKQKTQDLKRLAEEHEREMLKIRTENKKEVKRIMEEVRSKERQMNSVQRELSGQIGQMAIN